MQKTHLVSDLRPEKAASSVCCPVKNLLTSKKPCVTVPVYLGTSPSLTKITFELWDTLNRLCVLGFVSSCPFTVPWFVPNGSSFSLLPNISAFSTLVLPPAPGFTVRSVDFVLPPLLYACLPCVLPHL